MRKCSGTVLCAILLAVLCKTAVSKPMSIARGGKATVGILLPKEPSPTEKHAAAELARCLGKICGGEFGITCEPQNADQPWIAVGRTSLLTDHRVKLEDMDLGLDGFVLRSVGQSLLICGINDRGTLYGVYELLRKYVGCGWYMPGEIGEVVPQRPEISLPEIDEQQKPAFEWRGFTGSANPESDAPGGGRDLAEWYVRNHVNILAGYGPEDEEVSAFWAERGGMRKRWGTHSWGKLLPYQEYFDAHPAWYAMIGGQRRTSGRSTKLCTTNKDVIERIASGAIEYLSEHPNDELYAITESDGLGWCECEECSALDDGRMWEGDDRVAPVVSNRMITFANAVAARVARVHPGKVLYILAYHADFLPPSGGLEAHPNVMVQVVHCRPNYNCYNHPMESACERNTRFRQGLEQWRRTAKHVTVYDYARHSKMMTLPFIAPRKFVEDFGYLKRVGVDGFICQGGGAWGIYGIDYYAIARAMWDTDVDAEAMLSGFYNGLYGSAAPHMRQFYETLESALRQHDCINLQDRRVLTAYLTPALMERAEQLLQQGLAAAQTDIEKQRVQITVQCFEYARRYVAADRARWRYEDSGEIADLRAAVKAFEGMVALLTEQGTGLYLVGRSPIVRTAGVRRVMQTELSARDLAERASALLSSEERAEGNIVSNASAEEVIPKTRFPEAYGHDRAEMTDEVPAGWGCYVGGGSCRWGVSHKEAHSGNSSAFMELTAFHTQPPALGLMNCSLIPGLSNGYQGPDGYVPEPAEGYVLSFWYKGTIPKIRVTVTGWVTEEAGREARRGVSIHPAVIEPTGEWQQYVGVFVLDAEIKRFVPKLHAGGHEGDGVTKLGILYVDDVVIRPIPAK